MHYTWDICLPGGCGSFEVKFLRITEDHNNSWLCSGIMRLTVTVVVIMFELTGALTYILPTMVN